MKKTITRLAALGLAAALLTGCSSTTGTDPAPGGSAETPRIAFVTPGASFDFFAYMAAAARKTAEENGATVDVLDGNFDVSKMSELLTTAVAQNYDVIMTLGHPGLVPAVLDANQAGIPVVNYDARLDGADVYAHIASDNVAMGRQIGDYVAERIGEQDAHILILGYPPSASDANRAEGFHAAFEGKANVTFDELQPANTPSLEEAQKLMKDVLVRMPKGEIDYIFATSAGNGLGALAAVQTAGRDEIQIVSVDAEDGQLEALKTSPSYLATIAQDGIAIGTTSTKAALAALKGEKMGTINVPTILVTRDNVDQYAADLSAAKAELAAYK